MLKSCMTPRTLIRLPTSQVAVVHKVSPVAWQVRQQRLLAKSTQESEASTKATPVEATEGLESDSELKAKEQERLRAAEKFMIIGSGTATCGGCGYEYKPDRGDPDFPVPRGTTFKDLPADYACPTCGAPKPKFQSRMTVVAGFAENQKYGIGTNSWTGDQKLFLIYGSLVIFFVLFLAGYALE